MARKPTSQAQLERISGQIAAIAQDAALLVPANFAAREQARVLLAESIIAQLNDQIDRADKGQKKQIRAVKRQACAANERLQQVHAQLFDSVREQIRRGQCPPPECWLLLRRFQAEPQPEVWDDPPRYDQLDTLVDGLLQLHEQPRALQQPEAEMVQYQPTPARIVLDLIQRLRPGPEDVFVDLGCGLGRVAILAGLLSPARVLGIEYEPAYVEFARCRVEQLNLDRVSFSAGDARHASYAHGTIFYLYTPFKGSILDAVLARLHTEARARPIKVCTYGPGTLEVLPQSWLASSDAWEPDLHRATIFTSR